MKLSIERIHENIRVLEKFNDGTDLTNNLIKQHREALSELLEFESHFEFIIDTLETVIEWADYADDYFKKKHGLDQDRENVNKSIEILKRQMFNVAIEQVES